MAKIVVTGIKEIDRKLKKLGPVVANKVVVSSMRKAMKPLAPKVAQAAPHESGRLAGSVKIKSGKRKQVKGVAIKTIIVYIARDKFKGGDPVETEKQAFYATIQEYGSRYQRGKGYMRKVYDANAAGAKATAIDDIRAGIFAAI